MTGLSFNAHTSEVFKKNRLLSVIQIYKLQIAIFMFRYSLNKLPTIFRTYFCYNMGPLHHDIRSPLVLMVPYARTNARLVSIKCQGPRIWNALPADIYLSYSLRSFRTKMISHILDQSKDK